MRKLGKKGILRGDIHCGERRVQCEKGELHKAIKGESWEWIAYQRKWASSLLVPSTDEISNHSRHLRADEWSI